MAVKSVQVRTEVIDQTLFDPFEPRTYLPNSAVRDPRLSLGAVGLLGELIVSNGDWSIEGARLDELQRHANGTPTENLDELLAELAEAGYVTLVEE